MINKICNLIVFLILLTTQVISQQVIINEVMTSNVEYLWDEDGDTPDWIELFNTGNTSVNMSDFFLSDNKDKLKKWQFPDLLLKPGELFVFFASGKNRVEWYSSWESIIKQGDTCDYKVGNPNIPENWNTLGFNEVWEKGPSGFGYTDGDDNTIIDSTAVSIFVRKEFEIQNKDDIQLAVLHMDYDDGFIAYLNGTEIARSNLGFEGEDTPYDKLAFLATESKIVFGKTPEMFKINNFDSLLNEGKNVLAVQVHNSTINSSDLTAIPFLSISRKSFPQDYYNIPEVLGYNFCNIHTNFKLASNGEEIILSNKDGIPEDAIKIPKLAPNISYGRSFEDINNWGIFYEPTPWNINSSKFYNNLAEDPIFSKESGFYTEPFFLEFTNEQSNIFYSTDGSDPDSTSYQYNTPFLVSKTTIIRARLFENNSLKSKIITRSFLFNEESELPIVSLSTDPKNLWDHNTGIYVLGPNANSVIPYDNANFWQDWERPIHIDYFEADGDLGFEIDAGVKIFGGWSRAHAQKSLAIYARGKYGEKDINYKLFPKVKNDNYGSFLLRSSGSDWDNSMIRDGVMDYLVRKTSLDYQSFVPVIVFLNGEYWGIHNMREKLNEHFFAYHHKVNPNEIDIIWQDGIVEEGNDGAYLNFINFLETNDLSTESAYKTLDNLIDIDNFLEYFTAEIYYDNTDWPGNNVKMWREQSDSAKWKMILYDTDFGFGLLDTLGYLHNTLDFATTITGEEWPNPPWSTFILRKLLENDGIKNRFINQFSRYFNTTFSRENVKLTIDKFKEQIESEIPRHIEKWNAFDIHKWNQNLNVMYVFNDNRINYLNYYIIEKFNLLGEAKIKVQNPDYKMGKVILDGIEIKDSLWHGNYFVNSKIKVTAKPDKYYTFSHWEGDINNSEQTVELVLSEVNNLIAHFEIKKDSSSIVINEINYNSSTDFDTKDWIELYNTTNHDINVTDWIFKDTTKTNSYIFPKNTIINKNEYLVVVQDSLSFSSHFPNVKNFVGDFQFGLNNDGESIVLYESSNLVDSVKYNDKKPWPSKPDGDGRTLELVDYKIDNNNPDNWGSSTLNGTPGKINDRYIKNMFKNENVASELFQNFPNPFNSSTLISFNLDDDATLKLEIFDILGRKVKTIINDKMKKGVHSVKWDGKNSKLLNVSNGIYLVTLKINDFIDVKKMILLK